jgi:hypothetical protein
MESKCLKLGFMLMGRVMTMDSRCPCTVKMIPNMIVISLFVQLNMSTAPLQPILKLVRFTMVKDDLLTLAIEMVRECVVLVRPNFVFSEKSENSDNGKD